MARPPRRPPGDYDIGFGRPPSATQFRPGQSGNPRGRPKGQPGLGELLAREAARKVRVQIGETVQSISKQEAMLRSLLKRAMEGDIAAARLVYAILATNEARERLDAPEEAQSSSLSVDLMPDEDTLRRMLARFDHLRSAEADDERS